MLLHDLLFVFFLTLFLTVAFVLGFRKQRSKSAVGVFFVLLFLTTWAAGVWIVPVGEPWGSVPWKSFLVVGILIAILLAAITPFVKSPRKSESGLSLEEKKEAEKVVDEIIGYNLFFWVLIVALIGLVIAYYL